MLTGVSIIDVYCISECPPPYFRPLCSQRQISHTRPRSQGVHVLSWRPPQHRHLGDGPRLSLRFQPVSRSLHFDSAQQKEAHMFIHIHLIYCSLSLSLGGQGWGLKIPSFCSWLVPWSRKWQPTSVFLSRKSHEQRSLVYCSLVGTQRVRHNWAIKHTRTFLIDSPGN